MSGGRESRTPGGPRRPRGFTTRAAATLTRLLLLLYPPSFRREVGDAVVADVRRRADDLSASRGAGRLLSWIVRLAASLVGNAFAAWGERIASGWRRGRTGGTSGESGGERASALVPAAAPGSPVSWIDVRLGLRMLRKHPGLSVIGGFGIAVAIAISGGFFAFAYSYFYPDIPLDEGDRLVGLENWDLKTNNEERRSLWDYAVWREEMESVEDMTAFTTVGRSLILGDGPPELVRIARITPSGFRMARVPPLVGRTLVEEDAEPGAPPVVVVGHDVWKARFASDPGIVGREVRLGREVHTIVGVMPEGFHFPFNHSWWTPLGVRPSEYARGEGPPVFVSGRLAPAHTLEEAQAELSVIGARMAERFPDTHGDFRAQVMPYAYPLLDVNQQGGEGFGLELAAMNAMIALLLLVVSVNVAVLVYARTATRRGEVAVRTALGASRRRIVTQLFVEALVLSALAAVVGLGLIRVGLVLGNRILEFEVASTPFWIELGIPGPAIAYVVGLAVLAAVIMGVIPGLQATGGGVQRNLARFHQASGPGLGRVWTTLIVVQVALAVAAIPSAAAIAWWEFGGQIARPAFPAEDMIVVPMAPDLPDGEETEEARRERVAHLTEFRGELVRRVSDLPGVVGWTTAGSFRGSPARVEVEAGPRGPGTEAPVPARVHSVGPDFFEVFDAELVSGRALRPGDAEEGTPPVVVSRTFVREVLGGGEALGRRIRVLPRDDADASDEEVASAQEIVGVVEDLHTWVAGERFADVMVYRALTGEDAPAAALVLRTSGATEEGIPDRVREIAGGIDPTFRVRTIEMEELYRQGEVGLVLTALVLGLGVLAVLLLSAGGIYALTSVAVTQRRREIGIRRALGARAGRLLGGVLGRAAGRVGVGVVVGIVGAAAYDRYSGGDLFRGHTTAALTATALLISIVGVLAALGPARRGLAIEPAQVLKDD